LHALAKYPNEAKPWYDVGKAYQTLGDYDSAITYIEQALALGPQQYQWWQRKGDLLVEMGRNEAALDAYNAGLQLGTASSWCHTLYERKGAVLMRMHRYEEALDFFNQALARFAYNTRAQQGKEAAMRCLGQYRDTRGGESQTGE
jgi:superkiller protein 3